MAMKQAITHCLELGVREDEEEEAQLGMEYTLKSKPGVDRQKSKVVPKYTSHDQREDISEASSRVTVWNPESSASSTGAFVGSSAQKHERSVSLTKTPAKPNKKADNFFPSERRSSRFTATSAASTETRKSAASTRSSLSRSYGSMADSSENRRNLNGVADREEHSTNQSRRGGHESHYSHDRGSQRTNTSGEKKRVHRRISTRNGSDNPMDTTPARTSRATREGASDAPERDSVTESIRRDWSRLESSLARSRHRGSTTFESVRELSRTSANLTTSRLVRRLSIVQNELGTRQESAIDIAIGTLLLILLLVFVGLLYALFTHQKNATGASCTGECLNAKRYLEKLINIKHNACGDFYERVCSSWSYTNDSGFIADMVKETEGRLSSSLLEESRNTGASEQVIRARTIYRSCYTYATSDVHRDSALLTADKILKFSSLRKSENWNELLQSLIRFSFEVGVHTVFSMDFVGDKGRPVLHIAEGRSIRLKRKRAASSKKFEDIMRQTLGVPIERVTVIDQDVHNALHSHDSVEKHGSLESFVSGAIQGLSAIDWIIAVNKVVPKFSRIRLIDAVITVGIDNVRAALNVLTKAGLKDAIEYHVASMAADAALFDVFQPGPKPSVDKAASFCLLVTKTLLRYSWSHVAADVLATTNRHQMLRDIFSLVKEALSNSQVLYWTSDSAYAKAAKEVHNTLLLISHGLSHRKKGAISLAEASDMYEYDSGVSIPIATLFKALKDQRAFSLAYPPSTHDVLLWKKEATETLSYVPSASAIVVPTLYQMPHLLYSEQVPVYFNYGTVGAVLALETMAAFALAASYTTPDGHREYWWSGMNPERYNDTIGCLHKLYADLGFGLTISDEQTDAMVTNSLGLRLAFDSMHLSLKSVAREDSSDAMWNQAARTFFMRFCLLFCDTREKPRILSPRERCLLAVHSMKEFAISFECDAQPHEASSCPF